MPLLLERCQAILDRYFPVGSPQIVRIAELRKRLRDGRLQLAVLGQFKRGKSTFLNSLLGAPYLPSAVIPVTAIPTFIAWGKEPLIRVSYQGRENAEEFRAITADALRDLLYRFVAEEANPENRLRVSRVEIFVPAPILEQGIVLVDTPGVGSTHRHNTDAALKVLPECDAALFVVSVDPPITEGEIEYLHLIRSRVERLFFILNKTDLVASAERDQALAFMRMTLEKSVLIHGATPIFTASARSGLAARQAADGAAFVASGIAAIEKHLLRYLALEKNRSLEIAVAMKASVILSEAESELNLRRRTLELPLEMLGEKQTKFEELVRPIEARRLITRDLLKGERNRIAAALEMRTDRLRNDARGHLFGIVDELIDCANADEVDRLTADAAGPAMTDFFDAARDEMMDFFVSQSESALSTHRERIWELVDVVRRTAADLFELQFPPVTNDEKFHLAQEPYWLSQRWSSTLIPDFSPVVDRLLAKRTRRTRLEARIKGRLDELIIRNVENLRWSILRGLDETFARAAPTLESRIDEAMTLTRTAIANARRMRETQSSDVEAEIARLAAGASAMADMRAMLTIADKPQNT
jgi:GTP-binding protein EngB required for normal cell division